MAAPLVAPSAHGCCRRARVPTVAARALRLDDGGVGVLQQRQRADSDTAEAVAVAELGGAAEAHELLAEVALVMPRRRR